MLFQYDFVNKTKVDKEMEGKEGRRKWRGLGEAGGGVVWASRIITGIQAQPNPWMLYAVTMKLLASSLLTSQLQNSANVSYGLHHSGKVKELKTTLFACYVSVMRG